MGLFDFNLVAAIFGAGSVVTRIIYILVGLSALWQFYPLMRASQSGQVHAERRG